MIDINVISEILYYIIKYHINIIFFQTKNQSSRRIQVMKMLRRNNHSKNNIISKEIWIYFKFCYKLIFLK